jgi:hypothetical protein
MNGKNMEKLKLATLTAAFFQMAILLSDAHADSAAADSGQHVDTFVFVPEPIRLRTNPYMPAPPGKFWPMSCGI